MEITDERLDGGRPFDWGKTSAEYAKYRDIYPPVFYEKITDRGLCISGQNVLDIGTGTGVLPRNMYHAGAHWTGTDISFEQIEQAKLLIKSSSMDICYYAVPAEDMDFADKSFDVITACQCFFYFDHEKLAPILYRILKDDGKLLVLYMTWLPYEDELAKRSEEIVLKYSPLWSGAGETRHPIEIPRAVKKYFETEDHEEYDIAVPFTRETWHGRMRACRGVGASLGPSELKKWDEEHKRMLEDTMPEHFEVLHYAALTLLRKKHDI